MNPLIESQINLRRTAEEQSKVLNDLCEWEQKMLDKEENRSDESNKEDCILPVTVDRVDSHGEKALNAEQVVEQERMKGNDFFKLKKYDEAIKSYSRCIQLDPCCMIAYSNRGAFNQKLFVLCETSPSQLSFVVAMAFLKLKQWKKAAADATSAIVLDPTHLKSYQRRALARSSLGMIRSALLDLNQAKALATKTPDEDVVMATIEKDCQKLSKMLLKAIEKAPLKKISIDFVGEKEAKPLPPSIVSHINKQATTLEASPGENKQVQVLDRRADIDAVLRSRSWLDFEQVWKSLSQNDKVVCLERVQPKFFSKIYKYGMESSDMLFDITSTCVLLADPLKGVGILKVLGNIQGIDMVVLMMSKDEKKVLRKQVESLFTKESQRHKMLQQFGLTGGL